MTKKARHEFKAAWNQAIREGRMVNFGRLGIIKPYPSPEAAAQACAEAVEEGINAFVVPQELAQ